MRFQWSRDFFIPKQLPVAKVDVPEGVDAEIYTYEQGVNGAANSTRFHAICFYGKQQKPAHQYYYRTAEARAKAVAEWIAGRRQSQALRAEWTAKRNAPSTLKVGDILNTCWGYDQTNVEFYEVVEVIGARTVMVRELAQRYIDDDGAGGNGWYGKVMPVPGSYVGEPTRHIVSSGCYVKISECQTAHPWRGTPEHVSSTH
jgi:hypothetical protein